MIFREAFLWRARVIYRVPMKEKVVALTSDDGPHPTFTPEILKTLDRCHVKATFLPAAFAMKMAAVSLFA